MQKPALIVLTMAALQLPAALAQHPNHSIAPEKPKPTPYGLQISRSGDVLTRSVGPWLEPDGADLGQHLQAIEDAEKAGGAYDVAMVEPLEGLGRTYQSLDQHGKAMQYFKRALQISRINEGLYSEAQLPILTDMIDSHLALGELDAADEMHSWRYRVQRHVYAPTDPLLQEATTQYIDWQRQAYLQGITAMRDEAYLRLLEIHDVYSDDIDRLASSHPGSAELTELLYQRVQTEYLISQYDGEKMPAVQISISQRGVSDELANSTNIDAERFRQLREFNFRNGRKTLDQIRDIADDAEAPDAVAQARARLALGDWYQWWGRTARALQNYEQAWAILANDGSELTNPDELFPEPVELPDTHVFHPDGLAPGEEIRAHATVSLMVSPKGQAREIEIVSQEPPEDMGARVVLYRLLRQVRFRPVVRDGQAVAVADVVLDYRYQY